MLVTRFNSIFVFVAVGYSFIQPPARELLREEKQELTLRRAKRLFELGLCTQEDIMENPMKANALNIAIGQYDFSLAAKYLLDVQVDV